MLLNIFRNFNCSENSLLSTYFFIARNGISNRSFTYDERSRHNSNRSHQVKLNNYLLIEYVSISFIQFKKKIKNKTLFSL